MFYEAHYTFYINSSPYGTFTKEIEADSMEEAEKIAEQLGDIEAAKYEQLSAVLGEQCDCWCPVEDIYQDED